MSLVGQRSRDVIGRLSVSRDAIGCEDRIKSDCCVSISLLLVKKVRGSIVSKMSMVCLSPQTVFLRTTLTRMIIIYLLMT